MTVYPLLGNTNDLVGELRSIGCDEKAVSIFSKKFDILPVKIIAVKPALANIVKQEMLSSKGDAVVHSGCVSCSVDKTDVLLLGSPSVYDTFLRKLEYQDYPTLMEMGRIIRKVLDNITNRVLSQKLRSGRALDYGRPLIMGILNVTGDSFYDGGRHLEPDRAAARAEDMEREGADIIDIGGESTRPGSQSVPEDEELSRVVPVIRALRKRTDIPVSIDTTKSAVARAALEAGADIVNDISALRFDPGMARVVREQGALAVLMHIRGTPRDMQNDPRYEDVVRELVEYFDERVAYAAGEGIPESRLILDPGIGFGKTPEHNILVLKNIQTFRKYGLPLLVGASRKSMVGSILGGAGAPVPPEGRLFGTLAAHAKAFAGGADIFRVHDVREHAELFRVLSALK